MIRCTQPGVNLSPHHFLNALRELPRWYREFPSLHDNLYFAGEAPYDVQFHTTDPAHDGPKEMLECAYNISTALGMKTQILFTQEGLINEPV